MRPRRRPMLAHLFAMAHARRVLAVYVAHVRERNAEAIARVRRGEKPDAELFVEYMDTVCPDWRVRH